VDAVEIHIIDDINYLAFREDVIKAFEGFKDVDPYQIKNGYQSTCQKAYTKMMMKLFTLWV
jgi:hypothetical protein